MVNMAFSITAQLHSSDRWYYNGPEAGLSIWGFFTFGETDRNLCRNNFKQVGDLFTSELARVNLIHEFTAKILSMLQVAPPDVSAENAEVQQSNQFLLSRPPLDSIFTYHMLFYPYHQYHDYVSQMQVVRCGIWNNKNSMVGKNVKAIFDAIDGIKNHQQELREKIASLPATTAQFPRRRAIVSMSFSPTVSSNFASLDTEDKDILLSRDTMLSDLTRLASAVIQKLGAALPNVTPTTTTLQRAFELGPKTSADWKQIYSLREEIFKTYFNVLNDALAQELDLTDALTMELTGRQLLHNIGKKPTQ